MHSWFVCSNFVLRRGSAHLLPAGGAPRRPHHSPFESVSATDLRPKLRRNIQRDPETHEDNFSPRRKWFENIRDVYALPRPPLTTEDACGAAFLRLLLLLVSKFCRLQCPHQRKGMSPEFVLSLPASLSLQKEFLGKRWSGSVLQKLIYTDIFNISFFLAVNVVDTGRGRFGGRIS